MQRISNLYDRCGAAEFGFSQAEFCDLVTGITKRFAGESWNGREGAQFIEALHLEELVLAQACARGHEAAWERFLLVYRNKLHRAAAAMTRDGARAGELADSVYADLFGTRRSKDGRRNSKLELYCGRGSLEGWLRTVLAQEYVNLMRRQQKFVAFEETIDTTERASALREPDLRDARLAECTDAELAALGSEERFLLTAYYLDERTLAEIGRMLNVHESTVARRLERITKNLRKRIIGRLRARGLSQRAAEEMLEMDVRDLGIDVRNRLAQERQA